MSIKEDVLKKVKKKAQKIRNKRVEASNNKTLEDAVFEFFKKMEQSYVPAQTGQIVRSPILYHAAVQFLDKRLKSFDARCKFTIQFNETSDVRGITIWWSSAYIQKNNVDPSLCIDISQMLLI